MSRFFDGFDLTPAQEAQGMTLAQKVAHWKRAIVANWEKWHDVPREDGLPRYHAQFKSGEEFWQWWLTAKRAPIVCQEGILWTNSDE
jgi:hypothetical protein